jgi:hypothetical protein
VLIEEMNEHAKEHTVKAPVEKAKEAHDESELAKLVDDLADEEEEKAIAEDPNYRKADSMKVMRLMS